jgi:hypothetical protein
LKRRHQASGIRHQGCGYGTAVELADTKSNGQSSLTNPIISASVVANNTRYLKPETCSLMPFPKADS